MASWIGFAQPAAAFVWEDNHAEFYVDEDSFADNIEWLDPDMHLESNQMYAWWVAKALSVWSLKTGVNDGAFTSSADHVTLSYGGNTTVSGCPDENTVSEVSAVAGCLPIGNNQFNCAVYGETSLFTSGSYIAEADVCIYGGAPLGDQSGGYALEKNALVHSFDFLGLLSHELGHALGMLGHQATSSMMFSGVTSNSSVERTPTFADMHRAVGDIGMYVCGAQGVSYCDNLPYGAQPLHISWRERTDSVGWGDAYSLPTGYVTNLEPTAAIGRYDTVGAKLVVGVTGTDHQAYFLRTTYPLLPTSTWDAFTFGSGQITYQPPAIAARSAGQPLWLAAFTRPQVGFNEGACPGIRIARSSDAFESVAYVTLDHSVDVCTVHRPSLAWDPITDRFILGWVSASTTYDDTNDFRLDGIVRFATSLDGETWTVSTVDTNGNFYAADAPAIACAAVALTNGGNCTAAIPFGMSMGGSTFGMTYEPRVVVAPFLVDATSHLPSMTSGAFCEDSTLDAISLSYSTSFGSHHLAGAEAYTSFSGVAAAASGENSLCVAMADDSALLPTASTDWPTIGVQTRHNYALASTPFSERLYAFYVVP